MKYLIIISILIFFAGCKSEKVKPVVMSSLKVEQLPSQESWNSIVFFTDSGKTKAVLETGHLRVFNQARETLLDDGVKVDFYNDQEIKTTTLTSKRGRVDDTTRDLYAIDSVVAVNDSGITITTEELMWRNKDHKIVSDKYVTIISEKERIEGYGFESDQSLRNYTIYKITYVTRLDE